MRVIIVGGGKIGYYLVKTLLPYKHDITIIEKQMQMCRKIADELDVTVLRGDGTDLDLLNQAEVEDADVFIAVTGRDEDNLIACQLAKRNFDIDHTIARVNNPKNIEVFQRLGVNTAVSSTSIIAELIEKEIDQSGFKTLMKLQKGNLVMTEIHVSDESEAVNMMVKDLKLPAKCVFFTIMRGNDAIIPNGYTELKEKDTVLAISKIEDQQKLRDFFT